jgi:hypothetical protein
MSRWYLPTPNLSSFSQKLNANLVKDKFMKGDVKGKNKQTNNKPTKHRLHDSFAYHCRQKVTIQCLLARCQNSLFHSRMCHFPSAVSASWGQIDALLGVKHTNCLKVCCSELQRQVLRMFITRLICKVHISILWNSRNNCAVQTINRAPQTHAVHTAVPGTRTALQ